MRYVQSKRTSEFNQKPLNGLYVAEMMSSDEFKNLVKFFSILLQIDQRVRKQEAECAPVRTTTSTSTANIENKKEKIGVPLCTIS